jgi:hypothetical protein
LSKFKKWGFRWIDQDGCIRKYRRPVEGVLFLLFFLAPGCMVQYHPEIADLRNPVAWGVLFVLWGVAQVIISNFTSYDMGTWVRHPTPQPLLGLAFLLGILPGVVLYVILRNNERRFLREVFRKTGADAVTSEMPRAGSEKAADVGHVRVDRVRWYHIMVAVMLPSLAPAWGVVKLLRGERRSGTAIILISFAVIAFFGVVIFAVVWSQGRL